MEYDLMISEMEQGMRVEGFYLLKEASIKKASNGKLYLSASIMDASGSITMMMWDYSGAIDEQNIGQVVKVRGDVSIYKNSNQITASRLRLATDQDNVDLSRLVPVAPIDPDARFLEVTSLVDSLEDEDYRAVAREMLRRHADTFRSIPAAKSVHHGYVGGLLEHTLSVVTTCDHISLQYPYLNRDLLITSAMLHDVGKLWELSPFPENDYTDEGQLLGHIMIGTTKLEEAIRQIPDFPKRLKHEFLHCIISHHGELEFGSPKKPALAEALALSMADNLDAKLEVFKEALSLAQEGSTAWMGFNRLLDSNIRPTGKAD